MLRPLLIGLVAGARAMTPLAMISLARRTHRIGPPPGPVRLDRSTVMGGLVALALAELAGDKWREAPDRTVAPGLAARLVTGALAGAALSPPRRRIAGAALASATAGVSSYATLGLRRAASRAIGPARSGLVEDLLVLALAGLAVGARPVRS